MAGSGPMPGFASTLNHGADRIIKLRPLFVAPLGAPELANQLPLRPLGPISATTHRLPFGSYAWEYP